MLWLLDKSASLYSLIKRTWAKSEEANILHTKRLPVLPSGGITNTRGQNTRSSHPSSGMCEWRGHRCARGHEVLVRDIGCCGRWTCGEPACTDQGTSDRIRQ